MANFGPFFGPWMAKSFQKRSARFDNFPTVSRVFCIFSLLCDHDLSLFYCPYLFTFLIFLQKSTTQHTTYTILNHTHAHTQTHLPLTVILRVVCVRVTRGKTREICLKKAKSGESLAKARGNADGQIVRLLRSGDRPIEPSGSWFPPKFPSFSRKKSNDLRIRQHIVLDLFSNLKLGKILCLLPVNPSSK